MSVLEVSFGDVGQGDCSTISCPDGSLIIIDTGPFGSPLVDWLADNRRNVHALILTHNDRDHAGSVAAVLDHCERSLKTVYFLVDRGREEPSFKKMTRRIEVGYKQGFYAVKNLTAGETIWEDQAIPAKLFVAYPNHMEYSRATDSNTTSGVICLSVKNKIEVVWPGDCPLPIAAEAVDSVGPYTLMGPHHGSVKKGEIDTVRTAAAKLQPANCFISVGTNNKYGHPNSKYIKSLEKIGTHVRCSQITDICDHRCAQGGGHVLASHLVLGLRPPRTKGVACRGCWQITLGLNGFVPDILEAEHERRIKRLHRPQCLAGREEKLSRTASNE
jgi:competence protein ComEC